MNGLWMVLGTEAHQLANLHVIICPALPKSPL